MSKLGWQVNSGKKKKGAPLQTWAPRSGKKNGYENVNTTIDNRHSTKSSGDVFAVRPCFDCAVRPCHRHTVNAASPRPPTPFFSLSFFSLTSTATAAANANANTNPNACLDRWAAVQGWRSDRGDWLPVGRHGALDRQVPRQRYVTV